MNFRQLLSLPPLEKPRPKIALVLGGGTARGFAHIGVIRELVHQQVPIDMIVGTSVGSLIGALYAADGDIDRLESVARPLKRKDLFDYGLTVLLGRMGLAKGEKLAEFVRGNIPKTMIEELKIPFAAVATDLRRGQRVVLDKGPLVAAIRASCAIPGIFAPVEHEGRLLVDGLILENLPVAPAREMGADLVIAVDISRCANDNHIDDMVDVIVQSVCIMSAERAQESRSAADILITPDLRTVGRMDFDKKDYCIQAGVAAARNAMPEITKALATWEKASGWARFVPWRKRALAGKPSAVS